ncbi:hypothetical protein LJ737_11710 [Hymenobacter sp. 15J16-1T3B]|uniref:hypothetical protein n=1 Tax=Hymenobacter sp. 15J16-1T3B TaxID=2886941 RepID=UPI001D0FA86B|nr:hypothetical protein [Hymenobacter sp. 15J16-1T3B]MCC3157907.1 hypothetical protein [Hymenobacter sp. 15J16-1T3B]
MQDTYSNDQLQAYGKRLAARLCDQYFATQPVGTTLDGPAVLRLAPVRQLNLYVVQQLLAQWTQEMARLRSPYFDYEDAAVRQALTQLMNLLSRRIRLTRASYEPLLAQAAADTLRTALDPLAAFDAKLLPADHATATPAQLRDALRYVDVNKPLFQDFIDSLPADLPQEREFLLSRFRLYRDAHYKDQQPLSSLLDELNAVVPVTEDELRAAPAEATPVVPAPAPAAPAPVAAPVVAPPVVSTPSAAVEVPTEQTPTAPVAPAEVSAAPAAALPTAAAPEAAAAPAPVTEPMPAAPAVEVPVASEPATATPPPPQPAPAERPKPLAEAVAPANTLADKLAANVRTSTLADKLASTGGGAAHPTLAEAQPKVESLRSAISINQRFSFINELFNGENMEYHAAIEHLDALPTADAARRYISEDLAQRYQWVRKEEHVNKLLRLVERKFA